MKVRVIETFVDKDNNMIQYAVGEVLDLADGKRVEDLTNRKLVEKVDEVTEAPKKSTKRK